MFGFRKRPASSDFVQSRTILCRLPLDIDSTLAQAAASEIDGLEDVKRAEVALRGSYYGLWVDFYRPGQSTDKGATLAKIEEIMAGLAGQYEAMASVH